MGRESSSMYRTTSIKVVRTAPSPRWAEPALQGPGPGARSARKPSPGGSKGHVEIPRCRLGRCPSRSRSHRASERASERRAAADRRLQERLIWGASTPTYPAAESGCSRSRSPARPPARSGHCVPAPARWQWAQALTPASSPCLCSRLALGAQPPAIAASRPPRPSESASLGSPQACALTSLGAPSQPSPGNLRLGWALG
jgi:hypothetical protein